MSLAARDRACHTLAAAPGQQGSRQLRAMASSRDRERGGGGGFGGRGGGLMSLGAPKVRAFKCTMPGGVGRPGRRPA